MLAAVDLGSNSFRMHIGRHEGGVIRVVKSARDPIRLAASLDENGFLSAEAIQRAVDCLARFREILNEYPVDSLRVVATNTVRIAKNAQAFLPAAEKAIGCPIEIISGEEEGRLIYMGVSNSIAMPGERRLVIDIGGGSTEVILGRGHEVVKVESFSIGTVRQSNLFFPNGKITETGFEQAILSARSVFEDAAPPYQPEFWRNAYGSSGTIRAIADAISKNGFGDGALTLKNLRLLKQYCVQTGQIDQIDLVGIKPERIAMVVGGLAILMGLFEEFQITQLQPIEAGLRMGVMWDLYLRFTKRDRREQAVEKMGLLFHVDRLRAKHVADMAGALYGQLKPNSELMPKQLFWSALMHEIGMVISHTDYHKHGAYMVENADMAGFTTREQRLMSRLILSQKGNLRKVGDNLGDVDFAKAVLSLRLSVMFLHSRAEFDFADIAVKMKNKIEMEIRQNWVALHPTIAFGLQKEIDAWREVGIDFIVRTYE